MNKYLRTLICGAVLAAFSSAAAAAGPGAAKDEPQGAATLNNLQTAYNGESNAHARYAAFAEKASAEGYGPVASLFRAAARAEEVHANNHAEVIRKLGGEPAAKIEEPAVKSTRENLEAAIKGETYERDVMYPDFIKQEKGGKNKEAVRTFTFARTAEAEHAKLYSQALQDLDKLRGEAQPYYVCPVCGYTTDKLDFEVCPSSGTPKERYEKIS